MSVLTVQLVPDGVLFAADRNITSELRLGEVTLIGQSPRPKVLRWPNRELVIGYVGLARIEGKPTDQWLYDFIGRHLTDDLENLGEILAKEVEAALKEEREPTKDDLLIIHLGGFAKDESGYRPVIWFVRNAASMEGEDYKDISWKFFASDEVPKYFDKKTGKEIRDDVKKLAEAWKPFWFHQGAGLLTFNALDNALRSLMEDVVKNHPKKPHPIPCSLEEWEKHLKLAILGYGAYFESFHPSYLQIVGGGADTVTATWP